MRDLGAPRERLATVCVTGTLQEQVSDAIMWLCGVYAQFGGPAGPVSD